MLRTILVILLLLVYGLEGCPSFAVSKGQAPAKKHKQGNVRADAPCLAWVKAGVPSKAVLLCVHGLGLNSQSWESFGSKMSALGFPTYAIDVRGFGSWMQAKGHQDVDFSACIDDVSGTLEWIHRSHPENPIFLVGESMGGAIVIQTAAKHPDLLTGVISACGSGDRFKQKKTDLKVALHILTGPRRDFDIGKSVVKQATTDPQLREEWSADPLNRMSLSARDLVQFQGFMNRNHKAAEQIKSLPVLMVQGSKDGLVKPEGTEELYNELATPDKELVMVPNGEHLIFEESQCSDKVLQEVSQWLIKHLPKETAVTSDIVLQVGSLASQARTALDNEETSQALKILKSARKLNPKDAKIHYMLGEAYYKEHRLFLALRHWRLATKYAKGSAIAKDANRMMLSLPQDIVAAKPDSILLRSGIQDPALAGAVAGIVSKLHADSPAVIVFNASWCEPCKNMSAILDEAKKRFQDQVDFQEVNVDDPANRALVDYFNIGPVPTTAFLTSKGKVAALQVGFAGKEGMINGILQILSP